MNPRKFVSFRSALRFAVLLSVTLTQSVWAAVNFTQIRTKTYGPYAFEKVACGDFFGIGVASVAVMKPTHSQIIFLNTTSGTTTSNVLGSFDVNTAAGYEIKGLVAGDVDGDGKAELIILRNALTSPDPNVLVYKLALTVDAAGATTVTPTLHASLRIGGGTYGWRGVACGDFDGDGKDEIVVLKDTSSQFIIYGVSGSSVVQKGFVNLPNGGTSAGINDWRGLSIGDIDHDGSPEIVAVRYASGSDPDILVYKIDTTPASWAFNAAGTFNSTTHYPWVGVAVGEFDSNATNGDEIALCKNTSPFFNFYDYVNSTTPLTSLGGFDFQSATANPWTAIAAGRMSLRATGDCLISIRQSAPAGQALEAIYGDEAKNFNAKKAALQKNGFSFGTYHQAIFRNAVDNSLDVTALKNFIITNKLKTFEPMVADLWDNGAGTYIQGREYVSIVALIDALAAAGSECQIIPLLVPPSEISGNVHYTPYPGDSPLIGVAELGGSVTDERTLFGTAPDYRTWFKLIGIIAKKYPNNVSGVSIDDFTTTSNRTTFTRQALATMIGNLRASSNTVAFIPVVYYAITTASNLDYYKDYADGFTFYERNEKTKNATLLSVDVTRTGTAWNMHGAIVLPSSDISGGLNLANTEINDVSAWVGNANSLLFVGIYASTHSQSTTAPTAFTTDHLMKVAKASSKVHGLMIYTTQNPASAIGTAVYNNFSTWWGP